MSAHEVILSTVLNVDDFEPGRYARTRVLSQAGYHVEEAGTGTEALEKVREARPAVVILDVNLPDINGLEVCRRIKGDPLLASTLVLQISAQAITAKDWAAALETGADAYLIEPIDPAVLVATVRALLRLAQSERALQRANAELTRSNEDLARFAYIASHDLQEPLRTITAYSQLLERRCGDEIGLEGRQLLGFVTGAAGRMGCLIRDLLLYSQANARREPGLVRLGLVLDRTVDDLHVSITESGAEVTHSELPSVWADEEQIAHVFQNLLSNAIKYRSEVRPVVHVTAEPKGEHWLISVTDNGRGFPQKYAAHVFEPFRRLDSNQQGTGIGLAIVRRIVESHGGEIWAESEPGKGSTFYFTVPAVQQHAAG